MTKPEVGLRATPTGLRSAAGVDTSPLNEFYRKYGGTVRPLFGVSEERLLRETAKPCSGRRRAEPLGLLSRPRRIGLMHAKGFELFQLRDHLHCQGSFIEVTETREENEIFKAYSAP